MRENARAKFLLPLILAFIAAFPVQSQVITQKLKLEGAATAAFVREYKLDSKLTARQMPYNLIVPENYDSTENKAKKYPVIYLLHGLTGHYDNWTDKTKLAEYAFKYQYIFVMPEGDNGWYTDSATIPNDKYESYVVQELIPEIDKKFRTVADKKHRAVAGLSMGGYGAIKFGLKYPESFALVGSFSGALGAASWAETEFGANNFIGKSLVTAFGKADSETRRANDIFQMTREMPAGKIKTLPFVYLDCGTEDFLIKNNQDFADLLFEKRVAHEFRQLPGKHDWKFWDAQVREFLDLSEKYLK